MKAAVGRLHHVAIDSPDPEALAEFSSELLGPPVTYRSLDWVVIADNDSKSGTAFPLTADHQPPPWRRCRASFDYRNKGRA